MGCSPYAGDPRLTEGCMGCEFVHPPGMLCREQRTALTTARARSESKRDLGQVALRLQTQSSPIDPSVKKALRRSLSCDRNSSLLHSTNSLLDSSGHLFSSSFSNNIGQLECAVNLPSVSSGRCKKVSLDNIESNTTGKKCSSHWNFRRCCPKLSEVFVWLCLLGLMGSVQVKAAPISAINTMEKQNGAGLWINPCGMGANDDQMPQGIEIPYVSDRELLNQIVVQAKNALAEAESFKVDYVKKTFKTDFVDHHKSWKLSHYDWLPSKTDIPKDLGEDLPSSYFNQIQGDLDFTLANSYEHLQRFAVGLEQVSSDQRANLLPFKDSFTKIEYKLRAVLCEIQVAIIERNAERRPDITRSIMDDEFRVLDDSYRDLRDWIIYRDYMNALEYIIKVFEFYSSKMP